MKTVFPSGLLNELLCWAVLLAALYPVYNSSSKYQGWGGDYAGYVLEAKKIASGESIANSNYLYNPRYAELAPPAYPVGFPMLLASVYKAYGLDMLAFSHFVGIFWWLTSVCLFLLLKQYYPVWISLVTSLFFLFNPLFFFDKNAVLSDYPFAVCFLLAAYFHLRPANTYDVRHAALVGFFAAYAWLTRTIGFVLPLGFALHFLWEYVFHGPVDREELRRWGRYLGIVVGMSLAFQAIFHGWLFPMPSAGSYFDQLNFSNIPSLMQSTVTDYLRNLLGYFQLNGDLWYIFRYKTTDVAAPLGGAIVIGLITTGFVGAKNKHERFLISLILPYVAIVLLWPSIQGLRFLLPVIPVLLYFLIKSIDRIKLESVWGNRLKWAFIPLLLFGEYNRIDRHIYTFSQVDEIGSPEWKDNQKAFRYVRDSVPAGAVFGYHHPLIFALYTDKPAMRWAKKTTTEEIREDFKKYKVDYLLLNDWLTAADAPLKSYLNEYANQLDTVWHSDLNVLYKLKY